MLNKLTKSQVIMALTALRDKTILDSKDLDLPAEKKWLIPDCLEWAIDYIEEEKQKNGKKIGN